MAVQKQNNAENKGFYKSDIYQDFVRWHALPRFEKMRAGILDQTDFAKTYGVNKDTLTRWKQRPDFDKEIEKYQRHWTRSRKPDMMGAIFNSAMKGDAASQKLWLQYTGDLDRKREEPKFAPILREEDVRYFINVLPEDLRTKYNSLMDKLLLDIYHDAKAFEDGRLDEMSNNPNYDGL